MPLTRKSQIRTYQISSPFIICFPHHPLSNTFRSHPLAHQGSPPSSGLSKALSCSDQNKAGEILSEEFSFPALLSDENNSHPHDAVIPTAQVLLCSLPFLTEVSHPALCLASLSTLSTLISLTPFAAAISSSGFHLVHAG